MNKEIKPQDDKHSVDRDGKSEVIDPLEEIKLSDKEIRKAVTVATSGAIVSSVPILKKMFEWVERVNQATREQALRILLREYSQHFASIDDAISKLKLVVGTREGQTLFKKVVQVLSKSDDEEWIKLLANILRNISSEDIESHFRNYEYVLAQIDRISPQSLIIISKYDIWKDAVISSTSTSSGHTVSGDWDSQVSNFLARKLGITAGAAILRIGHSFSELSGANLVLLSHDKVKLSLIGAEVYRSITI